MPMQLTYSLQHSIVISLQVYSFCFNRTTDRKSLGRPLKDLITASCPYSIFAVCGEVKVHTKFQTFVVFILVCRTCIQNI